MVEILPQAMVHAKHAAFVVRLALPSLSRGSSIASPEISPASSNWTSCILRVGIAPISLMTFIKTCVPSTGRPSPVTAFSTRTFLASVVTFMKATGSLILPTPFVPRTATAFRFLEAITVPTPERPAARCRSLIIPAYKHPASADRPTAAILSKGSWYFLCKISSASQTDLPQISSAGTSSAFSFST